MNYPIEKYRFYTYKNEKGGITVAAVSTYEGRTVKGYAKCDPRDSFDLEKGKALAAARCNARVTQKRQARARKCYLEAERKMNQAKAYLNKMANYYEDAKEANSKASRDLEKFTKSF